MTETPDEIRQLTGIYSIGIAEYYCDSCKKRFKKGYINYLPVVEGCPQCHEATGIIERFT